MLQVCVRVCVRGCELLIFGLLWILLRNLKKITIFGPLHRDFLDVRVRFVRMYVFVYFWARNQDLNFRLKMNDVVT